MSELFSKLGIDWRLLSGQIVQFVLLVLILYKLAYKPIIKLLEERTKKIEKSLADAKRIEQTLSESSEERTRLLDETHKQAEIILTEARASAEKLQAQTLAATKQHMAELQHKAEVETQAMKDRVVDDAKGELAELVVAASERVLRQKMTSAHDKELIEEALREVVA